MNVGQFVTQLFNFVDSIRDFPLLSEEAERKLFSKIGEMVQIIVEDVSKGE